jgi:hypothetical protein
MITLLRYNDEITKQKSEWNFTEKRELSFFTFCFKFCFCEKHFFFFIFRSLRGCAMLVLRGREFLSGEVMEIAGKWPFSFSSSTFLIALYLLFISCLSISNSLFSFHFKLSFLSFYLHLSFFSPLLTVICNGCNLKIIWVTNLVTKSKFLVDE